MDLEKRVAELAVYIAEKLGLKRPLVAWDLETTGVDVLNDRIVEYAFVKIYPDGSTEYIDSVVNPEIPIPIEAANTHGITDEVASQHPNFKYHVDKIDRFINDCDFLTFNGNKFDVPLLLAEFSRNGVVLDYTKFNLIDASTIFIRQNPRTLSAAYKQYVGEDLEDAHMAVTDVNATICVFANQLMSHDIPNDIEELHYYSRYDNRTYLDITGKFVVGPDGFAMFNIGKYKGLRARDFKKYLQWMLTEEAGFSTDVVSVAQAIYNGEIK